MRGKLTKDWDLRKEGGKKKKNHHVMLLAFEFVGLGARSLAGGQTLTGKRTEKGCTEVPQRGT